MCVNFVTKMNAALQHTRATVGYQRILNYGTANQIHALVTDHSIHHSVRVLLPPFFCKF